MGSWKVGRRYTSLSKNWVQQRSSFLAQWIRKYVKWSILQWRPVRNIAKAINASRKSHSLVRFMVDFAVKTSQKYCWSFQCFQKKSVWYGLWAGGIIGTYFFKIAADRDVAVNGERYREMISNSKIQELELQAMCIQQDVATCHTARVIMDLLRGEFNEHFISRSESVNWPPRLCD